MDGYCLSSVDGVNREETNEQEATNNLLERIHPVMPNTGTEITRLNCDLMNFNFGTTFKPRTTLIEEREEEVPMLNRELIGSQIPR